MPVQTGQPWNDWYHINGNTYGTWLRGDPRGWRARHHREHVEGDYKNPPPPGTYDVLHQYSQRLMTRPPVYLSTNATQHACQVMSDSLRYHKIETLAVAVDDHHYHILARFPDRQPRKWVGIAKKRSARALSEAQLVETGGVWAVRCRCLPIHDREHQINCYRYISNHASRGAAVWTFKDESQPL